MKSALTVARKELRALFQSPIALLFLGVFQLVTLFTFFEASRFFARNIADVRPLFAWLPLLLVFLTAAVTMRAWAEERKMGTLEVLMTLPVTTRDLVLGKFLASVTLVAVALALTLPLPIMVAALGPLDWGPVIGGYVGALLLGALYVSIGLCISARTDNQVVSLMLTLVVGGALWLVGTETITGVVGNRTAEILRAIGTGSRFESIERGVIDLRDLVYYAALTAFFLVLNAVFLDRERVDADSERGRKRVTALWTLTGLTAANAVAAVVWLAPVTAARVDLTENGEFSISQVTRRILSELDEPLYLDGYFSERTHPKLAPLVPQIRDMLKEYEIAGGGRVHVAFADPNEDEQLEAELADQYGIRSVPFQVDDRNETSVVNSFFHVLVRYGDKYDVLSFDELIEVYADADTLDVRLKNLEYDLTRTIKKVSQDFQTLASVLQDLPETGRLTLYATPATLPGGFADILPVVRKVAEEVANESGGKLVFDEVDPSGDARLQEELYAKFGMRPLAADLFAQQTFYFELLLTVGDQGQRIAPRGDVKEADLRTAIEAAIKRLVPGQLTTVGLLTEIPEAPPLNPQLPPQFQPPPPQPDYRALSEILGASYEVEQVTLEGDEPVVPDTVDVLLVAKPGPLTPEQLFAVDQFLMRGGRVIALAGTKEVDIVDRGSLRMSDQPSALRDLLAAYGVKVGGELVADDRNAPFPRPVVRHVNGLALRSIELAPYPFFVDVRADGFAQGHAAVAGLGNVTFPWASPLEIEEREGVTATPLARSSRNAWLYAGNDLEPPSAGLDTKERVLAVALTGRLPSYFKDKPNPYFEGDATAEGADPTGRTVKESVPDARLVVVGSSEIVSDLLLQLAQSPGGEVHRGNLQLLQNLVDWSTEDTDLLEIRSAGAFARTLVPLDDETRNLATLIQYVLSVGLLVGIAAAARSRRPRVAIPVNLPETKAA